MKVKCFLKKQPEQEIKVYQVPIGKIDSCKELVRRYQGSVEVSVNSNQNYLEFEVLHYYHDDGFLIVICKADEKQEQRTIKAYRSVEK